MMPIGEFEFDPNGLYALFFGDIFMITTGKRFEKESMRQGDAIRDRCKLTQGVIYDIHRSVADDPEVHKHEYYLVILN